MRTFFRKSILFVAFCSFVFPLYAEEAGVHRFATYNVRYVNSNNGDTGDKLWANRRDYVCQIVTDYDFDIVGMQEVTGNNQDPTTKKSQLQDICDRLPAYQCIAYEREDRKYSYNTIMYKSDKYECLDHCSFWLSPQPWSQSSCAVWTGGDIARRCIVAHFKVKATGEDFYFCCTHCNYAPQQAGIEGARVMHEEIPPLVGNKPTVLVGDFNMNRSAHIESYRAYASLFQEARVTCDSMLSLPTTNPQVTYTCGFDWVVASKKPSGTTEFDHHFYSSMEPLSYHIISEDYGRSVTPSDHYPLLVRYRLLKPDQTVFSASNEQELQTVLSQASHGDTIYLTTDSLPLTEPIRPSCSIYLIGKEKGTVLTCGKEGSMVDIPQNWSFYGENLIFKNASSSSAQGGCAIYTNGYELTLKNCLFIHCKASSGNGGAINATPHQIRLDSCQFFSNQAQNGGACFLSPYGTLLINRCLWQDNIAEKVGGGVYTTCHGKSQIRRSVFDNNQAAAGGALAINDFDNIGVLNSSITNNQSRQQGAVWLSSSNAQSKATIFQCSFLNNRLNVSGGLATLVVKYGGAALKIQVPASVAAQAIGIAHCSFINNSIFSSLPQSKFTSAALDIEGGYVCLMNNLLLANYAEGTDYVSYHDLRTSGSIEVWRNTYNLMSDNAQITDWKDNIQALIDGQWQESTFVPTLTDQFTYRLKSTMLGSQSICSIPLIQRMCSAVLDYDLSQDGSQGNYVRYDQVGTWRDANACYGSIEYVTSSGLNEIKTKVHPRYNKILQNGQIILDNNHSQFNILGQSL